MRWVTNREGAGRICLLNNRQMRERARIVETGPDRDSTGRAMVWWAGGASIRFGSSINVSAWHVGKAWCRTILLNDLVEPGFSHIPGRPRHPTRDSQVIEAFKKTLPTRWQRMEPVFPQKRL